MRESRRGIYTLILLLILLLVLLISIQAGLMYQRGDALLSPGEENYQEKPIETESESDSE